MFGALLSCVCAQVLIFFASQLQHRLNPEHGLLCVQSLTCSLRVLVDVLGFSGLLPPPKNLPVVGQAKINVNECVHGVSLTI